MKQRKYVTKIILQGHWGVVAAAYINLYVTRNKGKLLRNLSYIISHLIT
nr:MAG TPA: hypothetical protein [Caudoviricetes sp.]